MHPEAIQENQYSVPYHYLPDDKGSVWRIYRCMPWGYEYLAMLETITSTVLGFRPGSVLDFGCGDGRLTHELSRQGIAEVAGVDISTRAIDLARALVRDSGVEFHTSLDAVSGRLFDVIVAVEVLEHIPDDDVRTVLHRLSDYLSPNGLLLVSVPTTNVPLNSKHYRHYTLETLEAQAHPRFTVQHVQYLGQNGLVNWLIKKMLFNQFVIPTWRPWLRLTAYIYKRFAMPADASNGTHLIAVLSREKRDGDSQTSS